MERRHKRDNRISEGKDRGEKGLKRKDTPSAVMSPSPEMEVATQSSPPPLPPKDENNNNQHSAEKRAEKRSREEKNEDCPPESQDQRKEKEAKLIAQRSWKKGGWQEGYISCPTWIFKILQEPACQRYLVTSRAAHLLREDYEPCCSNIAQYQRESLKLCTAVNLQAYSLCRGLDICSSVSGGEDQGETPAVSGRGPRQPTADSSS